MSKNKKSEKCKNDENISINILHKDLIEIKYNNQYKIKLIPEIDSFKIQIEETNKYDLYQSTLDLKKLKELKELYGINKSEQDLIDLILTSIKSKEIEIINNQNDLKLILLNEPKIELPLNKKELSEIELKEKLLRYAKENNELKNENDELKKENNELKIKIDELKKHILLFENKNSK